MTRKPAAANQFYPGNPEELESEIKECFESEFGPGLPDEKISKKVKAVISPHAGYAFSGPCAAYSYKEIAESEADIYIIIGLSHSMPKTALSLNDWETPLGVAKNDKALGEIIQKKCNIPVDEDLHSFEHSLEVQVPFLQFINKKKEIKIVPIIASEDTDYKELGAGIKKSIQEYGKKVIIIASSDFTHFGPNYGYIPFTEDVKKNIAKLDKGAINNILKKDAEAFLKYIDETGATICGRVPIAVLLETVDSKDVKLLKYYTSGDIIGDYTNAVGYASIVFY